MKKLNLPAFESKIQEIDGKASIFDIIRKKYIILTPEEWVRQHFINFLISHRNYPRSLIRNESGLKYNQLQKRTDILVYDREGKVFMIIECKSANENLNQKAFEQLAVYNQALQAKFICITNGMQSFVCEMDYEKRKYNFLKDLPEFPA
jgi:hypothetical protein